MHVLSKYYPPPYKRWSSFYTLIFDLMLQILCSETHSHMREGGGGGESKLVSQTVSLRQLQKRHCDKLSQGLQACVFIFLPQSIVFGLLNVTRIVNPKPSSSKRWIF